MSEGAMRAIDTNVLVRMIVQDDARQAASAKLFVESGAWVSILALAEATWVLSSVYELSAHELAEAIGRLLDHRDLVLQESEAVQAALTSFRERPSLGFSDCLMLHLARRAGHSPLGRFDRNLARVDGARKI
jgi:predicted nucleic-acid-binding protein